MALFTAYFDASMADFAASKKQYESWGRDIAKKREFLSQAVSVIRRNTSKSLSWGVRIRELRQFASEYPDHPVAEFEPYTFCGYGVYRLVKEWYEKRLRYGKRIRFPELVFEHGDKHRGQMKDALTGMTGQIPLFGKKGEIAAFEAGDIIAWMQRREITNRRRGRPPTGLFEALKEASDTLPNSWQLQDWDDARRVWNESEREATL